MEIRVRLETHMQAALQNTNFNGSLGLVLTSFERVARVWVRGAGVSGGSRTLSSQIAVHS
jgi:hypothetical protein